MNTSIAILGTSLFGVATLYSVLSIWISRTRLPWLLQTLIVVAATLPMLVVRAGDLIIIVLVSSLFIVAVSRYLQYRQIRIAERGDGDTPDYRWPTISLKDFMSGVILFCALTALVARVFESSLSTFEDYQTPHPVRLIGIGFAIGLWSVLSVILFGGRTCRRRQIALLLMTMALTLFWASWDDQNVAPNVILAWIYLKPFSILSMSFPPRPISQASVIGIWLIFLLVNSVLVAFVVWGLGIASSDNISRKERVPRPIRGSRPKIIRMLFRLTWATTSILILTSMVISLAYCFVLLSPPEKVGQQQRDYQVGKPNGMTDLTKVGKEFSKSSILDYGLRVLPGTELESEIEAYAAAFENIDLALSKPNCTWFDWSTGQHYCSEDTTNVWGYLQGIQELRAVARGLEYRSLQALNDGRFDDVIADGVRFFRVAETLSIDAIYDTSLYGTSIEGMGMRGVQSSVKHASESQLRTIAIRLDEMMAISKSVDEETDRILKNERFFAWNHSGWKDRFVDSLRDYDTHGITRRFIERRNVIRSLLRTEIAAELYRHDCGRYPADLQTLVPLFLQKIPIDLYEQRNQTPFRFSVSPDGLSYQLCSVGRNGTYDGFVNKERYWQEGDMDLAVIFGDRLKRNQESFESFHDLEDMYDEEPLPDDDFEDRLDESEMNEVENKENNYQ